MRFLKQSKFTRYLILQVTWLSTLVAMGAWWSHLVFDRTHKLVEAQQQAGLPALDLVRTERMLFWESSFFIVFLILSAIGMMATYILYERRMRGVRIFFAGLSHELRTPLTNLRLQAESIATKLNGMGSQGAGIESLSTGKDLGLLKQARSLMQSTYQLEMQVERVLELSRLESGGLAFLEPLDLIRYLKSRVKHWNDFYIERLVIEFKSESIKSFDVMADRHALDVMFRNMFENSLAHSGVNSLNARVVIEVKPSNVSNQLQVIVSDLGEKTMTALELKRYEKVFERGERSQGSGLGLYLIRELGERQGIYIRFDGSKGFRTVMVFQSHKGNLENG